MTDEWPTSRIQAYEVVSIQDLIDEHFGSFEDCVSDIFLGDWNAEVTIPFYSTGELSATAADLLWLPLQSRVWEDD
jgi:hypothetical protein